MKKTTLFSFLTSLFLQLSIFVSGLSVFNANVAAQEPETADPLAAPPILRPVPEKYSDANRRWQGIPSLDVSRDGGVWVCWYSGGGGECGENFVLLAYSGDGGETWSKPIFAIDPPGNVRAFDPAIWSDPNGKLWLFWAQGEESKFNPSIWDGRVGVWAVTTENPEAGDDAVWSEPRRLSNGIMMGKPLVDSKDRRLFPVAIWRFDSKYKIDEKLRGAAVYVSTDGGETLDFYGRAEVPRDVSIFDEHNLVEKKDGTLWLLNRTTYGIGESFSTDGGATWTPVVPSKNLKHTSSRFFVRRLKSGALLLVKNGPIDADVGRSRMTAFLSTDDGATWSGGLVLDERNNVSYPDGGQTEDGTIFVTYDFDRYGEREIYVARFTEADVAAGKIVSDVGRLKILVNKATGAK